MKDMKHYPNSPSEKVPTPESPYSILEQFYHIKTQLLSELSFKAVRSPGPGGQNVNKVASKIILTFSIPDSTLLNAKQKEALQNKLTSRLSKNGNLIIAVNDNRSQYLNRRLAIKRFFDILKKALTEPKKRKETKIPYRTKKRRLQDKHHRSLKKQNRRSNSYDD